MARPIGCATPPLFTPHTIATRAELRDKLPRVRVRGYVVGDEECEPGAHCLAAATFKMDGAVEGALSVSGIAARLTEEHVPRVGAAVRSDCDGISERLCHRPSPTARGTLKGEAEAECSLADTGLMRRHVLSSCVTVRVIASRAESPTRSAPRCCRSHKRSRVSGFHPGLGPLILDQGHPAVLAAVRAQRERGHLYGAQHELETRVAERIQSIVPCAELVTTPYRSPGSPSKPAIRPGGSRPRRCPAGTSSAIATPGSLPASTPCSGARVRRSSAHPTVASGECGGQALGGHRPPGVPGPPAHPARAPPTQRAHGICRLLQRAAPVAAPDNGPLSAQLFSPLCVRHPARGSTFLITGA